MLFLSLAVFWIKGSFSVSWFTFDSVVCGLTGRWLMALNHVAKPCCMLSVSFVLSPGLHSQSFEILPLCQCITAFFWHFFSVFFISPIAFRLVYLTHISEEHFPYWTSSPHSLCTWLQLFCTYVRLLKLRWVLFELPLVHLFYIKENISVEGRLLDRMSE